MLERDEILDTVRQRMEPLPSVVAMWEGGSAAWGRVDAYSDIDLQLAVADEQVDAVFAELLATLETLAPIAMRYDEPEPTWSGHKHTYIRLEGVDPHLLVDACLMKASSTRRYQSTARHGEARVFFDKEGWLAPRDDDPEAQAPAIEAKREGLITRFEMFHRIPRKEHLRGRPVDAMAYYQGLVLRPLVEMLRLEHCPARHDFGPRYIEEDFPADVAARLAPLYYVARPEDLPAKLDEAVAWFRALAAGAEASA